MIRHILLGSVLLFGLLTLVMGVASVLSQTEQPPTPMQAARPARHMGVGMDASAPNQLTSSPFMASPIPSSASGRGGGQATATAARVGDFVQSPTMPSGQFVHSPVGGAASFAQARSAQVGTFYPAGGQSSEPATSASSASAFAVKPAH